MEQFTTHPVAPAAGVRRRRPGSGALMLAAVMALAGSGVAMGGSVGAQTRTYNLMISGVPSTVHGIYLTVTNHVAVCVSVTPGKPTNVGFAVAEGDTMTAEWHSAALQPPRSEIEATPCGNETLLDHSSSTSVTASNYSNFWFDLTKTQKD